MSYQKIMRYQRFSPDLQTEWGTYANPHAAVNIDEYYFRRPGTPMLARSNADFIQPQPMAQGIGYIGDYIPAPLGQTGGLFSSDTLKTVLILAGIALVLYWILKPSKEAKRNPCVSDFNAMIDSGWTPPGGGGGSSKRTTRAGKRSLRRYAQVRQRDSKGRFI